MVKKKKKGKIKAKKEEKIVIYLVLRDATRRGSRYGPRRRWMLCVACASALRLLMRPTFWARGDGERVRRSAGGIGDTGDLLVPVPAARR